MTAASDAVRRTARVVTVADMAMLIRLAPAAT